ncbi:MAG: PAS domain S-box protein [Deltaproteobacteria bacterium]|nr:PAS domain S-box protein [Deltaproteobacteria bacterium]MBW2077865.1 PAS domain S-box protein [Deltaproteobacteria bacterium]
MHARFPPFERGIEGSFTEMSAMRELDTRKKSTEVELAKLHRRLARLETSEKEWRRAEEALRESENKYRTIFETTGTATIIIEEDTAISLANREFAELSGYTKQEIEGRMSWADFVAYEDDLEKMKAYHNARRVDPGAAPRHYEYRFRDKQGNIKDIYTTFAMIPGTTKSVGSFLDITELKRADAALRDSEERLRFLSSQLLRAQEKERKRIAGELHDGIGQILSAIKFGVEDTLNRLDEHTAAEVASALEAVIPVIQNGVEEVRRICMDLRPSILDDLGILATISWFCREFQVIYADIRIEQEIDIEEGDVPEALKIVIYRVLQEALNNIAKHSKATLVRLCLIKSGDAIELRVDDNGLGFNLADELAKDIPTRGLGLASMKERTETSGGSFSVTSVPGKGSNLRASWPLPSIS